MRVFLIAFLAFIIATSAAAGSQDGEERPGPASATAPTGRIGS